MLEQRLYYIDLKKSRSILKCIQFSADENFNLMFEAPLDIVLNDSAFKLVNFGCDYLQDQEKSSKHSTLRVFTNNAGSLVVCYSPKWNSWEQITYTVFYFHKGYSKTFTAALESAGSKGTKGITFLNLEYYVAVYLPGYFFHLLNIQHPDVVCHSLFLTGKKEMIDMLPPSPLQSLSGSLVLDWHSGRLYRALLSHSYLLRLLHSARLDCEKMAALHCMLSCGRDSQEAQIIQWISENSSACHSFDPIQEFIIASSYWSVCPETSNIDKLLPHSSMLSWNPEIPGITLVTEEIALPLMKVHSFRGYWEKLNSNLEYVKYAMPHLHYSNSVIRREWNNLISEEKTGKRRSAAYVRNILDNATKVIFNLEARNLEPRLAPLFQEEDKHQRLLVGLLDLLCRILDTSWRKHNLHSWVLHFGGRGSAAEFAVFHFMTRILEATKSLFLPLPPGFHTLHTVLGVHCLPLHNLLHYIDDGVLLLTETAVTRLMKDLDNTERNEKLKFSVIVRLPPLLGQKISRLWDHPMSSSIISRNHVKQLLHNYKTQPRNSAIDKTFSSVDFLPLNYFIAILTDLESSNQALYVFEGHDNVDAKFVGEAALKHTTMLLGL
ncbi:gamma-secretase-activating protein isoform 2-T2 [Rhynchocyon petersi]